MKTRYNLFCLCIIVAFQLTNKGYAANDVQEFSFTKTKTDAAQVPGALAEETLTTQTPVEEQIYLNFDNASLSSVLNYLIERKNLDVIPHKDLAAIKVTLLSREAMSLSEAWETVLVLMEANNFTIVNVNGINRVVPLASGQQNSLPCYSSARNTEPEDLPDTNALIRYIYFCKNIKINAAQAILTPLLSDRAIQTNNPLQALILTDNGNNIKSAMRIVKELDIGGVRQAIKIMELQHVDAEQMAKLFNEQIIPGQQQQEMKIRIISEENKREMSYFAKDTKILADPTRNRLIFMGVSDSIDKIILFIKTYLDVPLEAARSRLHVKELRYYTAENMKTLLETMITPPKGQGGATGATEGEYKFFTDVVISAEQASSGTEQGRGTGNRLIISCNQDDWSRLERFIDDLDKPQPQVALEMLIVDVNTTDTKALGAQFRTKTGLLGEKITAASFPLKTSTSTLTTGPTNLINTMVTDANSSILSFGNATSSEVWGIIRAMYSINHTNIIQQPYLVINNNAKGSEAFIVTRRVPGALQMGSNGVPVRNLENADANVSIEITPHVNASGIIKLEISVSVNEFKEASGSTPDTTQRNIKSQASMAAGEVLVLGGLTSSKHSSQQWAVPFLSSIPIIGNLFKDRVRASTKSNLYVFIRPTVIKPHFGLGADEYTQLKLDYAKYQILSYDNVSLSKDPIQRYFFAPSKYGSKRKREDLATNRMPIIDDFAERRNMPNEVEMTKDPYFHKVEETTVIAYDPEEGFASMPHLNPDEYMTPGLLDELNSDNYWEEPEVEPQPMLERRRLSR